MRPWAATGSGAGSEIDFWQFWSCCRTISIAGVMMNVRSVLPPRYFAYCSTGSHEADTKAKAHGLELDRGVGLNATSSFHAPPSRASVSRSATSGQGACRRHPCVFARARPANHRPVVKKTRDRDRTTIKAEIRRARPLERARHRLSRPCWARGGGRPSRGWRAPAGDEGQDEHPGDFEGGRSGRGRGGGSRRPVRLASGRAFTAVTRGTAESSR